MGCRTITRWARFFLSACAAWAFAAGALTLEPLPGSTPQSTREGAFFPAEVGVVVREETGQPAVGVAVTYFIPWGNGGGVAGILGATSVNAPFVVVTDEDGIASLPWLVAYQAGAVPIEASLASANAVVFDLLIQAGMPASLKMVAGAGQAAPVDTAYPVRWAVQALDEERRPVPYAAVVFASVDAWQPGGRFGDVNGYYTIAGPWPRVIARADAHGVAVAPTWVASPASGHYRAIAMAWFGLDDHRDYGPRQIFQFTNTPAASAR